MKKYILFICFYSILYSDIIPYVSPGIQIGINSSGNFFFAGQITGGVLPFETGVDFIPIGIGLTLGKRYYYNGETGRFDGYNYIDGQLSMLFIGIGFGQIGKKTKTEFYNPNTKLFGQTTTYEKYSKTKFWIGSVMLLSYDYITSPSGRHSFGIFGVAPILLNPDY